MAATDSLTLQPELGRRLRTLRNERGQSLGDVAEAAGLSVSFLSMLENGKRDITLSRLIRLVHGLGIHLTDLVPELRGPDAVVIHESEYGHILSATEGVDLFLLAPDARRLMMPAIYEYRPGAQTAEYATHEGEEFAWVIEGNMAIDFEGQETFTLSAGDSTYFRADRPHIYRNIGKGVARVLVVVTPPSL